MFSNLARSVFNSIEFSDHTLDKATKAKVTLENYYSNLIAQHGERKQRLAKLEASLKDETLTETQKQVCGGNGTII